MKIIAFWKFLLQMALCLKKFWCRLKSTLRDFAWSSWGIEVRLHFRPLFSNTSANWVMTAKYVLGSTYIGWMMIFLFRIRMPLLVNVVQINDTPIVQISSRPICKFCVQGNLRWYTRQGEHKTILCQILCIVCSQVDSHTEQCISSQRKAWWKLPLDWIRYVGTYGTGWNLLAVWIPWTSMVIVVSSLRAKIIDCRYFFHVAEWFRLAWWYHVCTFSDSSKRCFRLKRCWSIGIFLRNQMSLCVTVVKMSGRPIVTCQDLSLEVPKLLHERVAFDQGIHQEQGIGDRLLICLDTISKSPRTMSPPPTW